MTHGNDPPIWQGYHGSQPVHGASSHGMLPYYITCIIQLHNPSVLVGGSAVAANHIAIP